MKRRISALSLLAFVVMGCTGEPSSPKSPPAGASTVPPIPAHVKALKEWEANPVGIRTHIEGLIKNGSVSMADAEIAKYNPATKGALNDLQRKADVRRFEKMAADAPPKDFYTQVRAYERLLELDPKNDKYHLKLAYAERQIEKTKLAERVAKRKQGVRVGMTQDDVLASSWGKPRKINRTTTARSTSEQWVYDGGYLYFDDGILTTIQN